MSLIPSRAVEEVVRRDRLIVIGGLATVVTVAWIYILAGAGMGLSAFVMTSSGGGMAMSAMQPMAWTIGTAVLEPGRGGIARVARMSADQKGKIVETPQNANNKHIAANDGIVAI